MSNVLIGIIGVILFIGLALAGALFLGPRFQESTNNSKASAAVQAVSQIASAANMSNVQGGAAVKSDATVASLQTAQYLKAVPSNPTSTIYPAMLTTGAGEQISTANAEYVVMQLQGNAAAICLAIARQTGMNIGTGTGTVPTADPTLPANPTGCARIRTGGIGTTLTEGGYYVFARI